MEDFYFLGVSNLASDWELLIERLGHKKELDDMSEQIWAVARASEEVPHMGNIYQAILQERLETVLTGMGVASENIDYYANGADANFFVFNESVYDIRTLKMVLRDNVDEETFYDIFD